jgi:cytochrome bd ubiquinol oxidase subunit I
MGEPSALRDSARHFRADIPVAIAGVTGSLFVISVNGWVNHPSGFVLQC